MTNGLSHQPYNHVSYSNYSTATVYGTWSQQQSGTDKMRNKTASMDYRIHNRKFALFFIRSNDGLLVVISTTTTTTTTATATRVVMMIVDVVDDHDYY